MWHLYLAEAFGANGYEEPDEVVEVEGEDEEMNLEDEEAEEDPLEAEVQEEEPEELERGEEAADECRKTEKIRLKKGLRSPSSSLQHLWSPSLRSVSWKF